MPVSTGAVVYAILNGPFVGNSYFDALTLYVRVNYGLDRLYHNKNLFDIFRRFLLL